MNYSHEYNIFTSDESFDYNGPFGTETCYQIGYHGFKIEFNSDDKIVLNKLGGFGYYSDIENCKTFEELKGYIENIIEFKDIPKEAPNFIGTVFDKKELQELIEAIKEKIEMERLEKELEELNEKELQNFKL